MLPPEPGAEVAKSIRQLATRLGVTHSALLRAAKDQRIPPLGKGPYDVRAYREALDANTKRTRPRAIADSGVVTSSPTGGDISPDRAGDADGRAMLPPTEHAVVEVPAEATAIIVETLREAGITVSGEPTLRETGVALEIMRGMKAKLEVDRLRGRSVDKAKALDVHTTHSRKVRNDLLAWPKAIAPTLARELGLGDHRPLEMALDAHLRTKLETLARLPPPADLAPVAA